METLRGALVRLRPPDVEELGLTTQPRKPGRELERF